MAIVSNRNSTNNYKFLHFILYSLLFLIICNLCYSLATIKRYKRDYKIDSADFREAVIFGVTNYLATLDSPATTNQSKAGDSFPSVKFADFGFYQDFYGVPHIILDGVEYTVGDFCEFGLIVSLTDRSILCRSADDDLTIVKARRQAASASSPLSAPAEAADAPAPAPALL